MNGDSEVAFREDDPVEEEPALPTHVTTSELSDLLKSWDEKFMILRSVSVRFRLMQTAYLLMYA